MTKKNLDHDIFLISPVNGILEADKKACREHIEMRKNSGFKTYFPLEDTLQTGDPIGNRILDKNHTAIKHATFVDFYLAGTTKGSFFDLGETLYLEKKLFLVNKKAFSLLNPMEEFAIARSANFNSIYKSDLDSELLSFVEMIKDTDFSISYEFNYERKNLFKLGVLYASGRPFQISNINYVQKTEGKSFQKVVHYLHKKFQQQ